MSSTKNSIKEQMRFLICLLIIPYTYSAHTICADNKTCPEGTRCCTTFDNKYRCCDVNSSDSSSTKIDKSLQVVPSMPLQSFDSASKPLALYSACMEKVNCDGTCCGGTCCPGRFATCCDGYCCSYFSRCCSDYTEYMEEKRWCCLESMRCGDAYNQSCLLNHGSFLTPHLIVVLITAMVQIFKVYQDSHGR